MGMPREFEQLYRAEHPKLVALGLATWLLLRFYKARRQLGRRVGPPVLIDDAPLPPDDLHSGIFSTALVPQTDALPASATSPPALPPIAVKPAVEPVVPNVAP